jgi:hypothetical protein
MRQRFGGRYALLLLLTLAIAGSLLITTATAQTGIGISPVKVDFGTLGRGGTATKTIKLYNTGNDTAINYTTAMTAPRDMGMSVTPASGVLAAKSNATLTINGAVDSNAQDGTHNGSILINTTAAGQPGRSSVLPALSVKVTYAVSGNAAANPATATSNNGGVDYGVVGASLGIIAVIAVVSVAFILRRR